MGRWGVLVALVVVAVGCGGDDDGAGSSTTTTEPPSALVHHGFAPAADEPGLPLDELTSHVGVIAEGGDVVVGLGQFMLREWPLRGHSDEP